MDPGHLRVGRAAAGTAAGRRLGASGTTGIAEHGSVSIGRASWKAAGSRIGTIARRLVRLPGTGVCTESTATTAQGSGADLRDRHKAYVRFALCQQPIKFDPAGDVLLARIARAAGLERILAGLADQTHALGHGPVARSAGTCLPGARARSRCPSARDAVAGARANFPWLSGRDGYLSRIVLRSPATRPPGQCECIAALPIVTLGGRISAPAPGGGAAATDRALPTESCMSRDQYVELAVRWSQQCREPAQWAARRTALRQAAPLADDNRAAVTALERALIEVLQAQRRYHSTSRSERSLRLIPSAPLRTTSISSAWVASSRMKPLISASLPSSSTMKHRSTDRAPGRRCEPHSRARCRAARIHPQLEQYQFALDVLAARHVLDAHDVDQFLELVGNLQHHGFRAAGHQRQARHRRVVGRGHRQRLDVVAAAGKHGRRPASGRRPRSAAGCQ